MKTVAMHWVWIGPDIPEARLNAIDGIMNRAKTTEYSGAIWWIKTGTDVPSYTNYSLITDASSCDSYQNLNGSNITGLMFELKNNNNNWKIPVFKVDFSERMNKWKKKHGVPDIHESVAARVGLSDVVRLKVLAWHPGLYLDFDSSFNNSFNLDFSSLSQVPMSCHTKPDVANKGLFYENDFIWVPPEPSSQQIMAELYIHITSGDVELPLNKSKLQQNSGQKVGNLLMNEFSSIPHYNTSYSSKYLSNKSKQTANPMGALGKAKIGAGMKAASWKDLDYNLSGCKPELNTCFNRIRQLPSSEREQLKLSALKYLSSGIIRWRDITVEIVVNTTNQSVRLKKNEETEKSISEHEAIIYLLDPKTPDKIGSIKATGEKRWDELGFDQYKQVMKSHYNEKASRMIESLFTPESVNKHFYSWRDPGSEDLIKALSS